MWHGSRKNRHYNDRHDVLLGIEDIRDIIKVNDDGVYELKDPLLQQAVTKFFEDRDDDGVETIGGE